MAETNIVEIIQRSIESGRLPLLIQHEDGLAIAWRPADSITKLSVPDVFIVYDSILFHTPDFPYELHEIIHAAHEFASQAAIFGIDVDDWKYRESSRIF